ncbi:MAG TPA: DUF5985 family protein [Planctomycetota bacterium]|nr:DUF5985 family protein [Planctomycetota bacterium]
MIEFLSGAVAMGYFIAALFFIRFWKKSHDRLFLAFAVAFGLFALNQCLAIWIGATDERIGYTYMLRVLGFLLIIAAIVDKNLSSEPGRRQ